MPGTDVIQFPKTLDDYMQNVKIAVDDVVNVFDRHEFSSALERAKVMQAHLSGPIEALADHLQREPEPQRPTKEEVEKAFNLLTFGWTQEGVSLQQYANTARMINALNGWGLRFDPEGNPETIGSYLALIHSEITEADDEMTAEKSARELGDVIIRALDLAQLVAPGELGKAGWGLVHPRKLRNGYNPVTFNWDKELGGMRRDVDAMLELFRKVDDWRPDFITKLDRLIRRAWALMKYIAPEQDVDETLIDILSRNKERGERHGGRRT